MRNSLVVVMLVACGGGGGGEPDAGVPDARPDAVPVPMPAAEIGVTPGVALAAGQWIVANDWAGPPDVVFALPITDLGGQRQVVFTATRVWSMGAEPDGDAIVFSSADPEQEADFGITIG